MLTGERWRHAKAIGAWGEGRETLRSRTAPDAAGVVVGEDPHAVLDEVLTRMENHRVRQRFPARG